MLGDLPILLMTTGFIDLPSGFQSLEVIPVISGPAPRIIADQFDELDEGNTVLALYLKAPSLIIRCITGASAFISPPLLNPSIPITTTCSASGLPLVFWACNFKQPKAKIVNTLR